MLTISQTRGLASRLERAQAIADAGAVQPITGSPDTWVVRNGDGDGTQHYLYLVSTEPERESCTCPDYQHHALGLPCKHIMAAQIIDAQPKGE